MNFDEAPLTKIKYIPGAKWLTSSVILPETPGLFIITFPSGLIIINGVSAFSMPDIVRVSQAGFGNNEIEPELSFGFSSVKVAVVKYSF